MLLRITEINLNIVGTQRNCQKVYFFFQVTFAMIISHSITNKSAPNLITKSIINYDKLLTTNYQSYKVTVQARQQFSYHNHFQIRCGATFDC